MCVYIWTHTYMDIYKILFIICVYCTQQRFVDCHPPFTDSNDCYQRNLEVGLRPAFS